jgi:uncharacterized protein YutE (UPF0331/DUF86 family)
MSTISTSEYDILQQLMPELTAEGYEVYIRPDRSLLPGFLQNFMPDAIALGSDKNLVIEVIHKSRANEKKLTQMADILGNHSDWELRVVWMTPTGMSAALQSQPLSLIRKQIAEIRELTANGHVHPAFLMAWATFEAIGRLLAPTQLRRPQTPNRLVQVLANEGHLTPAEADSLRLLADKRNKLVHGELKTRVSKPDVKLLGNVISTLVKAVEKPAE